MLTVQYLFPIIPKRITGLDIRVICRRLKNENYQRKEGNRYVEENFRETYPEVDQKDPRQMRYKNELDFKITLVQTLNMLTNSITKINNYCMNLLTNEEVGGAVQEIIRPLEIKVTNFEKTFKLHQENNKDMEENVIELRDNYEKTID